MDAMGKENERRYIEEKQAQGDFLEWLKFNFPIGGKVELKNWPVPGKVIGYHDGAPIIQPEACTVSLDAITSYTDTKGLVRLPFYPRFIGDQ